MSPKFPPSGPEQKPRAAPAARNSPAPALALTEAAQAWTALLDDWWRQQSTGLPPELERAMSAMLDQSKALMDMAFAQTARAMTEPPPGATAASATPPRDSPDVGEFGLWQPVIDTCRACEASLVGDAAESATPKSAAAREYQRAASAYLKEFAQINGELAKRLQKELAANPPADFRQLHALVVKEAENAYLDRVSTDSFAARQAAFINAMFKLRREMVDTGTERKG